MFEKGDTFFLTMPPKEHPELFMKELTVGMVWNNGDIWPIGYFWTVKPKYCSKTVPQLRFGLLSRIIYKLLIKENK
jgi:hypothetical protein